MKRKIILASRSKARRQILREAGFEIGVAFADVDESVLRGERVGRYTMRVALDKAAAVAKKRRDAVVIGVDTVISLGGMILGKPRDKKEAAKYLRALSGRWHRVYTGTVAVDSVSGKIAKKLVVSRVKFASLSAKQILWYISTGEPLRAAGAYSIQGKGRALIESVSGCLTNVIGISIPVVHGLLKKLKAI